jgi:hypothetical protein
MAQGTQSMRGGGCSSHDFNIDILGEVGIANGLAGNLLNGDGSPSAQFTHVGSEMGCDNDHGHHGRYLRHVVGPLVFMSEVESKAPDR